MTNIANPKELSRRLVAGAGRRAGDFARPTGRRSPMAACAALIAATAEQLNALGIGRGDRSRSCCRTGRRWRPPSSSVAAARRRRRSTRPTARTSSTSTSPTSAPRRSSSLRDEAGPAVAVAEHLGIARAAARRSMPTSPAGTFTLDGRGRRRAGDARHRARPDDIALLLHTSGTTSRPKLVPLSHANLAASAAPHRRRRWR